MKILAVIVATFGSFMIAVQAGVPTRPPLPPGCTIPCIDGVFVLDVSLSIMNDQNFQLMKDLVTNTFNLVNISANCSRAALILFASDARIEFNLNEYTNQASLVNAFDEIVYSQISRPFRVGTNTPSALDLLRTAALDGSLGLSEDRVRLAMLITDGRPNLRHIDDSITQAEANARTETAGNRLHAAELYDQIYAIGIEVRPIGPALNYIADPPELVFRVAGFNQDLFEELAENTTRQFCNPCILRPCPPGSICRICAETGMPYCEYSCAVDNGGCDEGSRCVEVNVPTCNPGECCSPVNITCQTCDVGLIDCVYVLDNSISIQDDTNFGFIRNLVTRSAELLDIGTEDALFSIITFARQAWINFPITEHTNRADLITAINDISYFDKPPLNRTGTNIPAALDLLLEAGRGSSLGLRSDANYKHVIFITDGRANTRNLEEERLGRRLSRTEAREHRDRDEANTIEAARRLHASGLYNDVFAIGITGTHDVNERELDAIASRPEFVFEIEGFSEEAFEAVIRLLSEEVCDACTGFPCPNGSICRICNETGEAYCDFSCSIDNGGCPDNTRCVETAATCAPGECCSVTITCETCDVGQVDLVYVLDNSVSIENDANFALIRNLVTRSAELVDIGIEDALFSIIVFARQAWINIPITQHTTRDDLIDAINDISYFDVAPLNRTGTNIPAALDLLREAAQDGRLELRPDANFRIASLITDGRANTRNLEEERLGRRLNRQEAREQRDRDESNTIAAARRLHASGLYDDVFAIGITGTHDVNERELEAIASRPEFVFEIEGFSDEAFEAVVQLLNEEICDACTGFPCPDGSICRVCNETGEAYCEYSCSIDDGGCSEGDTCIETPIACPPGQCCSPVNVTCQPCELVADLVFVLDTSISIGNNENFQQITDFVAGATRFGDYGPDDNLGSVILFARHANVEFHVQEHSTADEFSAAVTSIIYDQIPQLNRTGTNIPEALDLLRTAGRRGGGLRFRDDPDIPKIAIFITDGRPNTRDLTGNTRQQDAINTQNAAARLHESGIYDQIYGVGIQGERRINFVELEFIASDPGLVFIIDDFDEELFVELGRNLSTSICRRQECTVEGQVFLENALPPECHPTCSNPMPPCPRLPLGPGCVCPQGTVIDVIQNRCVPLSQCTCPPQCSHEFCSSELVQNSDSLVPCMRGPPPYTEADCTDDCQKTFCQACYYYPEPLPPPPACTYEDVCKGCMCCLREWARCVEERNTRDNECTEDCQSPENFKCYDYPICIN